ncbi:ornithine cyclodeaminase family protein [Sporosarcina siberiensis]|uniref:Ornithine cyclodeaminase family protein n=1 Tax=Sporosarcina siberiensis TaxID=1365606 RepID=A0ABW4SGC1_9BACL
MDTIILTKEQISRVLNMDDVIESVEEAYKMFSDNKVILPPVLSFDIEKYHGEIDIKSGYDLVDEVVGVKIASGYANNYENYGISNGQATIILVDVKNGVPLAIMEGGLITDMRTGAAGAVSAKYLARKSSKKVAIIGTGIIARWELKALARVFELEDVFVWGRSEEKAKQYVKDMKKEIPLNYTTFVDIEECVSQADIIITTTSSKKALIQSEWVKPGTHLACIGADMPGKQELETKLFGKSKIIVDSVNQCVERGEVQHAIRNGLVLERDLIEMGEVILGYKQGRESDEDITIFDSTGLSIQDITTAKKVISVLKDNRDVLAVNLI